MTQASMAEAVGDEPRIGLSLDERTHYAHVRYAASDNPGVIWYDPRDGHEHFTLGADTSLDALEFDDRVLTSVRIHAKHGRCQQAHPDGEWVLRLAYASKKRAEIADKTYVQKQNFEETSVHESVYAARDAAREQVPEYADAEYVNAVAHRLGDDDD